MEVFVQHCKRGLAGGDTPGCSLVGVDYLVAVRCLWNALRDFRQGGIKHCCSPKHWTTEILAVATFKLATALLK